MEAQMGRKDAHKLTGVKNFQRFYTFLMPSRSQAIVWYVIRADAANVLDFIEKKKKEGHDITLFHITIAALVRAASQYPEMNRFIYKHQFYARDEIAVSFAVSLGEKTVMRKVRLEPEDNLDAVAGKIRKIVDSARKKSEDSLDNSVDFFMKLPDFVTSFFFHKLYPWLADKGLIPWKYVDEDILYASAIVSNVGSLGLSSLFHHLYDWGSASVLVTVGLLQKDSLVTPDGKSKVTDVLDFGFSIDERICDGKKFSEAFVLFKQCIENPGMLETGPAKVVRE
jgi:chloramphenicol O-acetyltransferase